MARMIRGTEYAPIDLSTLVADAFIYCKVLELKLKSTDLHDLVVSKPQYLSADEIIRTLKNKLRSLKDRGLWSPPKGKKLDTEVGIAGLNLAMDKLVEFQKRGQTGGNGRSQDGKARDLSRITCFQCHKKGNLQDNHPLLKKEGTSSGNRETPVNHGY